MIRRSALALLTTAVIVAGSPALAAGAAESAPAPADQPTTYRIDGANRFETNQILNSIFSSEDVPAPPVVYVANAYSYPDALSAVPAAGSVGGAIVITPGDSLIEQAADQLDELKPARIVVVGGVNSISEATYEQIAQYAPGATTRIAGVDRYETSRKIAEEAFCPDPEATTCGVTTGLFASGANFADALSAGPAGVHIDAPVILVPPTGLDGPTSQLISRFGFEEAAVIGGKSSISDDTLAAIHALVPGDKATFRLSGENRYATSVAVAYQFFGGTDSVFVASGETFPDALSAGPVTRTFNSPIYLSSKECLPNVVYGDIQDIGATDVYLVGGPASLATPALDQLQTCDPITTKSETAPVSPRGARG